MPKPSVSNPAEFILSSFLKTFVMPGQPGQKPGRIAFLADFQCGKSTFFNLLCGGLEVSPRGNGVRTSSTIVEASYAPPEEAGAEIVWKPDADLAQIVNRAFPDDGPKSLADWRRLYARERDRFWRALADAGDTVELRRVAIALLETVGAPELDVIRGMTFVRDFEVLRPYVRYPGDWAMRWATATQRNFPFRPQECAFLFVGRVRCKVPSDYLRESGATIVDCPGLDSNAYETAIAEAALDEADLVCCLLDGAKAIGEPGVARIKALCKTLGKTRQDFFFALNLRQPIGLTQETIIQDCVEKFKSAGVFATPLRAEDIHPFHARLALQSRCLDKSTNDARLRREIRDDLNQVLSDDEDPVYEPDFCLRKSGFPELGQALLKAHREHPDAPTTGPAAKEIALIERWRQTLTQNELRSLLLEWQFETPAAKRRKRAILDGVVPPPFAGLGPDDSPKEAADEIKQLESLNRRWSGKPLIKQLLHKPLKTQVAQRRREELLLAAAKDAGCKIVSFQFFDDPGCTVSLVGAFNNWDTTATPMRDVDGIGEYTCSIPLPKGRHEYHFVVNGKHFYRPDRPIVRDSDGANNVCFVN